MSPDAAAAAVTSDAHRHEDRALCDQERVTAGRGVHSPWVGPSASVWGVQRWLVDIQWCAGCACRYLTLKANVESNYMARELKTVHVDNEATFVKILLHQCYINERNIYSQVGVMAINLCGEPLEIRGGELPNHSTGEQLVPIAQRSVPKPRASTNNSDDLSFDLRFDAKTAARIREIQIAKDQAVATEDYDQAKRLKQMEEQLKSIGLQLARLEAQKRDAVANEDYDLAKRIKDEINLLEASVGSNESQPIVLAPTAASPARSTNHLTTASRSINRSQVLPRAGAAAIAGTKGAMASSNFSPRDMYPEEQRGFPGDPNPIRPSSSRSVGRQNGYEDEAEGEAGDIQLEGGPNPNFLDLSDAENLPDPDEIPAALAKESEDLIAVIGPFLTRCFFSNLWNHRDAAIRKVTMELENYPTDPIQVLEVCSTLVQSGAGDRIAQVALSAFRLVDRMLQYGSTVRRDEMCRIVGSCTIGDLAVAYLELTNPSLCVASLGIA